MNSSSGLKKVITRVVSESIKESKADISKAIKTKQLASDKIKVHYIWGLSV